MYVRLLQAGALSTTGGNCDVENMKECRWIVRRTAHDVST